MRKTLLFILVCLVVLACSKQEPLAESVPQQEPEENSIWQGEPNLTSDFVELLDSIPTSDYVPFEDFIFEDGRSVQEYLKEHDPDFLKNGGNFRQNVEKDFSRDALIGRLTKVAQQLCIENRSKEFAGLPTRNGIQSPRHTGIAYVWGSSDYRTKRTPANYVKPPSCPQSTGCLDISLNGIDCSGFLTYIFKAAGIPSFVRAGTSDLGTTQFWNSQLKNSSYSTISAEILSEADVSLEQLKKGDIVVWPGSHCGIVLLDKSRKLRLFQSNGQPCEHPPRGANCFWNYDDPKSGHVYKDGRGARCAELSQNDKLIKSLSRHPYVVIRLSENCGLINDIEGNEYKTVKIGNQCWMKENLKATKFQDGTPIQYIPTEDPDAEQTAWWKSFDYTNVAVPKFPAYTHQITDPHGMVYNSKVILNSKNVCPVGWRIPSKQDYEILAAKYGWTEFSANGEVAVALTSPDGVPNPPSNINISDFSALVNATPADDQGRFAKAWIGTYTTLATSTRDLIEPDRYVHYMVQLTNSKTIGGWSFTLGTADARGHYIRCIKE